MAVEATRPNQMLPIPWPSVQDFCTSQPQQMQFSAVPSTFYPTKTVESGLTTSNFPANSRKRSLDLMNPVNHHHHHNLYVPSNTEKIINNGVAVDSPFSELFPQIQQHQLEIDHILSQHTKKMRMEIHERQKQQSKILATAIAQKAILKLREKDEQIHKMSKFNSALQERLKSLYMENQLWRDLAQTNEAQAQSLQFDLEQALAHAGNHQNAAAEEDAQSCCGSSGDVAGGEEVAVVNNRMCKICGERESCVLMLPCRHMCLCGVCGSGSQHVHACPVCNSTMTATLHVNLSP